MVTICDRIEAEPPGIAGDNGRMVRIRSFDHVGITVADLETATAFFVGLGMEVEGRSFQEGEFIDTVIGIPNARSEIVMLRPPNGGTGLELARFVRPDHEPGSPDSMSTELGSATSGSRWRSSMRSSTGWPRTATVSSAASASTRTCGAWRTCVDPRASSCPSPSESADAALWPRGSSAGDPEDLAWTGQALEFVHTGVLEFDAGALEQIARRRRNVDLVRSGQ